MLLTSYFLEALDLPSAASAGWVATAFAVGFPGAGATAGSADAVAAVDFSSADARADSVALAHCVVEAWRRGVML